MQILAIIPARGGSKRVPNKNIKELGGKPLIAYSIDHAKQSKYITRTIVSTDSPEILEIAKSFGAEAPFLRPEELAQDSTPDLPVFQHALLWMKENENYVPDIVVQLRPTSPLRKVEDVDRAIELLINNPEADSVRTVIEPVSSPYKMYKIDDAGFLDPLIKTEDKSEVYNQPDQQLPKVYRHIGTADVIWSKTILENNQMSGKKILPLILDKAYSGINTPEDWGFYEFLINK
jgi:CMP-N-acetylneuraminic acid synthetase